MDRKPHKYEWINGWTDRLIDRLIDRDREAQTHREKDQGKVMSIAKAEKC